jgi:hypothetical protein
VTATTGTFTDIIATNYSINNVSISNLIVSGVVRLTGIVDAPVTLLPEYEILLKDPYNNLVYKFSSLVFNTTSGTLRCPDIITALMTVGDIYVTGNLTLLGSMPALQVMGQTDLGTGLSIQSLASVASNSVHPLVVWNSTTKNISQDNTKLYYDTSTDTLYSPNISVTNFNIVPVTRSNNVEYPVVFFDDNTDNLAVDSVASAFRYNPSTNRLTLRECKVDGKVICDQLVITQEIVPGVDSQVKLFIEDGFNFKIEDTTNIEGFYFFGGVTEWMRIAVGETRISTDVEISGNTTLENSLTVETGTFLGSSLHVDALDPVVGNISYAVLLWDITGGAGNRAVTYDFTNFYYDTTSDTLFVPNISAPNLQIVAISKSDDVEYPVTFHDTALNKVCKDSSQTNFRYNPSTNKMSVRDINCEFNLKVLNNTSLGSALYVNILNPVAINTTYPLLLWDNTGALDNRAISHDTTKLYYDTNSDTLNAPNITASGQVQILPIIATGNSDLNVPFLNANDQIRISDVEGGKAFTFNPYQGILKSYDLELSNDLTVGGSTTICSKNKTATSELCRLLFLDGQSTVGVNYDIVRDEFLYYIPSSNILVSNSIRSQIRLLTPLIVLLGTDEVNGGIDIYTDGNKLRSRYYHENGHLFMDGDEIDSNKLFRTTTSQTRVYTPLLCDDVITLNSVPTAPSTSNTDILLLDSANNQISKAGITFNPSGNILATTNITLSGALSALALNTTSNATIGGNLDVTGILTATTLNVGTQNITDLDVTGILTAATLNVGTQSITDFEVTGDLTLTNLSNTLTIGVSYSLLFKNNTTDEVHETSTSEVSIGRGLSGVFIETEQIISNTFQCGNGLPVGYYCTYNCFDWRTYNHSASKPNGDFGLDKYVELHVTNTSGHNPTVTQHGANVYGTYYGTVVRSAINFGQTGSTSYWKIASNAYVGIWKVRVSCVFQNLSNARQTPKIYLKKSTNNSAFIEQPHISTAIDYARHDVGELVTLNLEGVVYLTSELDILGIFTLLETDTVSNPPTWPDSIIAWAGRDINIQMEFLGTGTSFTGEIVNAL